MQERSYLVSTIGKSVTYSDENEANIADERGLVAIWANTLFAFVGLKLNDRDRNVITPRLTFGTPINGSESIAGHDSLLISDQG
ncbi:hypothetical protein BG60_33175 [Caballeronia zhejiangensis]|uniref:Uncharacterized protein n=1 Tax=Caballeronia zhejiangensis TaxID=871203 RepID=A0A656QCI5_9BURK|nr:hypothetical protein BG60_33175 [Caballeronia zhejiangensis]